MKIVISKFKRLILLLLLILLIVSINFIKSKKVSDSKYTNTSYALALDTTLIPLESKTILNQENNKPIEDTPTTKEGICKKLNFLYHNIKVSGPLDEEESFVIFQSQFKKYLTDGFLFEENDLENLKVSKTQNFYFYGYDNRLGGTMRFYDNFLRYEKDGKIIIKKLDLEGEIIYEVHEFNHNNEVYYLIFSYGRYSSRDWSYEIMIATINHGNLKLHSKFFPKQYLNRKGFQVNGFLYENRIHLSNGSRFLEIDLEYNEKNQCISYNEIIGDDVITYELSGKRIEWKLNIK